ncbi:MAG: OmpA family protein [Desulfobacterales bacterium]|nr:OmpA family protein [Desulfobacterales bacterium]
MKKTYLVLLTMLLVGIFVSGCATMPPFSSQPAFEPQEINMASYQSKVENFVVILDASASMRTWYDGSTRFKVAKAIVSRMNQTLPNIDMQGGLRTFGHSRSVSTENTVLMYGMAPYTRAGLQAGLDKVTKADGPSPFSDAIDGANQDLRETTGKIALIIVTDGGDMGNGPVEAVMRLKKQYGSRVCIYTIAVGSNPADKEYLNKLAQIGECGYATEANKISTKTGMFGFVQDVFLSEQMDDDRDGVFNNQDKCPETPQGIIVDQNGCPIDTDGDGIADYLDKCPETSQGLTVDTSGCPVDADGDGVPNNRDACPETPSNEAVDAKGCPIPKATQSAKLTGAGTWLYEDIKFDSGSANIKPGSYPVLAEIAGVLNQNPKLKVEIQGHTDSAGSRALNNKLSADRADAVRVHLIEKGVNPEQLTATGYGPSKPLVSNDTPEGRAHNRRVELKPLQ